MQTNLNNSITPSEAVLINGNKFAKRKRPFAAIFIMGILIFLSFLFIYLSFAEINKSMASKRWPATRGKIELSKLGIDIKDNDTVYGANVHYSYLVNGKNFQNQNVYFGSNSTTPDIGLVTRLLKKYAVGMSVPVFYKPGDPQIAVLETGLHFQNVALFILGIIMVAILTPVLVRFLRLL